MSTPARTTDPDLAAALRAALVGLAREGRTATYRDLAARLSLTGPHTIHRVTLALEDLVREDHAAGRPLLGALAVSRAAGGIPGRGFFQLLAELGRYAGPDQGPQAARWHAEEVAAALDYWAERGVVGPGAGPG